MLAKLKQVAALFVLLLVVALVFGVAMPKVLFTNAVAGPLIFNYQGRILNSNGVPVTDADLDVIFELYDAAAAGSCVWSNSSATCATSTAQTVTLVDGLFSEEIGNTSHGYASLDGIFDVNGTLYLEVTIEGETLTPRKQVLSAPYAINAANLNGYTSDDFVAAFGDSLTGAYSLTQTGADTAFLINQDGNTGGTINDTEGGALHISNTGNNNEAFTIYSNNGVGAASPLAVLQTDNALFDENILAIDNAGLAIGLHIIQDTLNSPAADSIGNQALVIDVNETSSSDDVFIIRADADGTPDTQFRFQNDGNAYSGAAFNAGGADFAEYFESADLSLTDYDLVCSSALANKVERCTGDHNTIIGVISSNPAFIANIGGADIKRENETRPLVGLVGQIVTHVTNENGPIAVGDPITISKTTPGYGAKANSAGSIVGFALESFNESQGSILVYVKPQWHAGSLFDEKGVRFTSDIELSQDPDSAFSVIGSPSLSLLGNREGVDQGFIVNTDLAEDGSYSLKIQNELNEDRLELRNNGDVLLSGKLYLAGSEGFQSDAYLFYDGDSDLTTGYIRTNAAGFSSESYDFAEMYPVQGTAEPGDVVVFADSKETVKKSTGTADSDKIAGIVSTQPGFLAGKRQEGQVPVALSGRVPTKVTSENGTIKIGDALTLSNTPGYAMKATDPGAIIGYALEGSSASQDVISVFVRASYFEGIADDSAALSQNEDFNLSGGRLLGVRAIESIAGKWTISQNGDIYTQGRIGQYLPKTGGGDAINYAALTRIQTIQLSGTSNLNDGYAKVEFNKFDKEFSKLISHGVPYQVLLTPNGATGTLYVDGKTGNDFIVREQGKQTSTTFDWLVIAYPKDYVPPTEEENQSQPQTTSPPEVDEETEPSDSTPVEEEEAEDLVVDESDSSEEDVSAEETPQETVDAEKSDSGTESADTIDSSSAESSETEG